MTEKAYRVICNFINGVERLAAEQDVMWMVAARLDQMPGFGQYDGFDLQYNPVNKKWNFATPFGKAFSKITAEQLKTELKGLIKDGK